MGVAVQRPVFVNGGVFMAETRSEVDRYLASPRARFWPRLQLYVKAVVALALVSGSWGILVLARPGIAGGVLCLGGLALGMILVGFCVQHDANHGAYFRGRRLNHLLGWTADALLGFSSYAWRVKHNVAHHTYTNVDGFDDDIDQTPFARLLPSQPPRRWYRLQHLYIWPLYGVMMLRWQVGADIAALVRGRIAQSNLRPPRRWDLAGLVVGKAVFVGWAIIVPLLVYPWWLVASSYLTVATLTSIVTAITFQLAHCVEEANTTSPESLTADKQLWAVHEVESTVNFCPNNPVLTWILGGLNHQIEHHLFPRIAHTHYPQIATIVRRNALKHGISYTAQPSLRAALRSHQRHLRTLGGMGLAAEIEMG